MPSHAKKSPYKCSILRGDLPDSVKLVTPYIADFVEDLKMIIPPSHRKWNPLASCWEIHETYLNELVELCKEYFSAIETNLINSSNEAPKVAARPQTSDDVLIAVFAMVGKDKADKLYQQLAKVFHPDAGGSNDLMTKLNKAYEEVKRRGKS